MTKPKAKPAIAPDMTGVRPAIFDPQHYPSDQPRRWVRTTTVAIHDKDHEQDKPLSRCWVCDVKPAEGADRWAHKIIVHAPTDAECKKRADIIAEALNKGEANA